MSILILFTKFILNYKTFLYFKRYQCLAWFSQYLILWIKIKAPYCSRFSLNTNKLKFSIQYKFKFIECKEKVKEQFVLLDNEMESEKELKFINKIIDNKNILKSLNFYI